MRSRIEPRCCCVYLAGYAAIAIYYVGLLVVAMRSWVRRNAELRSASEPH
ncbi:MAG TPA: hypothetical protein VFT55_06650 [Planctomycetota bacterium]|nr:hypothetical protein [Planctomycetota bacterium]